MTEATPRAGTHLPVRVPRNRAMAATIRLWHTRNRARLEAVAVGLRALDWPAVCRSQDPLRGYAHAHQVMAAHAKHRCPRYRMAGEYTRVAR